MEVLKEIAYTLNRYQVQPIDVIANPGTKSAKKDNRYWEAYQGLLDQRWQDEAAFAAHFGLVHPSKNYNRFKNQLKDRLWNTLIFTEGKGDDHLEYLAVQQDVMKKWAIAEGLQERQAYTAYRSLAEECLQAALKYDLVKMVIDITTSLKANFIANPYPMNEYLRIKGIFEEYWPWYLAEIGIRDHYERFVSELVVAKGYKKAFAPAAVEITELYVETAAICPSPMFQFHFRLMQFYSKVLVHDWKNALVVAEEALAFFGARKIQYPAHLIVFNHQKVSCLLMLGQHMAVKEALDSALMLTTTDSSHRFKNRELATVNALYAEQYNEAWELCRTAIQQERFTKIPPMDQEAWRIYYGYLHFLAQIGKLELSESEKSELPKFRLSSWLNDLPLYSLDKRGAQIPVLILQALLFFWEGKWEELENRIEALRKFRQRNLDPNDEHFRTNCFIHLLELLPKHTLGLQSLLKASAPWLQKLSSSPLDILDRTFEIEVVPYERQWQWVLEIAGLKKQL